MTTTTTVLPHTTLVGGGSNTTTTATTTTTTTTTNGSSTMHTNRPLNTTNPVRSTTTTTSTTTSPQTTTTTPTTPTTSPRVLAQQAVQWYRDELDPTETHQTNVTSLFRPVVLSLTHFILQQQQQTSSNNDDETTAETNGGASHSMDWTDFLPIALRQGQGPSGSSPSSLPSPVSGTLEKTPFGTVTTSSSLDKSPFHSAATPSSSTTTTLSPSLPVLPARQVARMEAFLTGIVLAVPLSSSHDQASRAAPPAPQRFPKPLPKKQAPLQRAQSTATPSTFSLLDGLAGFSASNPTSSSSSSFLFRSVSAGGVPRSGGTNSSREGSISSAASLSFAPQQVQIRSWDLQIRLELYLRTLFRVVKASTHPTPNTTSTTVTKHGTSRHSNNNNNDGYCVLAAEPPRALKARCQAIATAFSETVGTVRQQGPVLTQLLTSMTLEVLAVPCLSETCQTAIRRVVMEYEHATSFASLAFLSSPDDAAHGKLVPLLQSYFQTLQDDWRASVHDCLMEHVLQTVLDADMRRFFKHVEFRSIGHLLETCAQYRPLLQHISVPPHRPFGHDNDDDTSTEDNPKALRQALNDLQRERITINGTLLPPVTSRSELIRILSQTLNQSIHQQPPVGSSPRKQQRGRSRHDPNRMRRSESAPTLFASSSLASSKGSAPTRSVTVTERHKNDDHDNDDPDDDLYLWGDQSSSSSLGGPDESPSIATLDTQTSAASTSSCLDMSTLDRLTKRLLLAASRTGTGGDAYFIVRDLFGGKDVQVLASPDLPSSRTNHHRTLELWIQLTSLTIHCHTSFDVYPKPTQQQQKHGSNTTTLTDYDPYSIADAGCEPLIQLHTTTTEVIALQQVRAPDDEPTSPPTTTSTTSTPSTDTTTTSCTKTVLQERVTNQSGWKTLSIRPALYEKLQVWTTPS